MFAYCQNNPVMYVDTSGNRHVMVDLGIVIHESEHELKTAGVSVTNQNKKSKSKLQEVGCDEKVIVICDSICKKIYKIVV